VVLYELCSAAVPYEGESMTSLVAKVMTEPPTPLSARRHGIPPGFEQVVLRCLERNPDARYQSAAELSAALAPFAGALAGGLAISGGHPAAPAAFAAASTAGSSFATDPTETALQPAPSPTQSALTLTNGPAARRQSLPRARSRTLLLILGGLVAGAVAGVGLVAWSFFGAGAKETAVQDIAAGASSGPGASGPALSAGPVASVETPPASSRAPTVTPQASASATASATSTAAASVSPREPKLPPTSLTKPTAKPASSSTKTRGPFL
jgi:serine/threonine protein kinase